MKRCVMRRQHARGQSGRGHRGGSCGQGHDDAGHGHGAGQHAADRQKRPRGAVLIHDQGEDQNQPADQRHDRLDVEEGMGK